MLAAAVPRDEYPSLGAINASMGAKFSHLDNGKVPTSS